MKGGRFDFFASCGCNIKKDVWFYKVGLAGENNFKVSDKVSLWVEGTAFSSRGSTFLRSTFMEYGGWDGMPGYAIGTFFSDFVYGGAGVQINLSKSFVSSFLSIVVRGGVRTDVGFGIDNNAYEFATEYLCVDSFTSGIWDLGISVGLGVSSPVGDVILGAGFNKNMQLAFYAELT